MSTNGISAATLYRNPPVAPGSGLADKLPSGSKTPDETRLSADTKTVAAQDKDSVANARKDQVQLQSATALQTLDTLQKISGITEGSNDTAKSLRLTVNSLSAADEMTVKMRSTLEKITKNFPPFPIDSAERENLLMTYRSLQKEMEQLMVPPPPQPIYEKVQTLWLDLFSGDQTEAGNVATPGLPEKAPDSVVVDASKQLAATSYAISTIQSGIGASF